jgi:hypothetical protein
MKAVVSKSWFGWVLGLGSFLTFFGICEFYRNFAYEGVWFQDWPSDVMQQYLQIAQLQKTPWSSVFYVHIQPPMIDAIRALFSQFFDAPVHPEARDLLKKVDGSMMIFHGLVLAFTIRILYAGMRNLWGVWAGVFFVIFWTLHPSTLFYATLMDGTYLSSAVILGLIYAVFKLTEPEKSATQTQRFMLWSCAFAILAFYTRPFFQWYFFPIFWSLLALAGLSRRLLLQAILITLLAVTPWLARSKVLYNSLSTTSYQGYHILGVSWVEPSQELLKEEHAKLEYTYPEGAKLSQGTKDLAQESTVRDNLVWQGIARKMYREDPWYMIQKIRCSFAFNFHRYWKATSKYTGNQTTDRLPWAPFFQTYLSGTWLKSLFWWVIFLHLLRVRPWTLRGSKLGSWLARVGVVGYIFCLSLLCNRMGWTEVERFKLFLEPLLWLWVIFESRWGFQALKTRIENWNLRRSVSL